MIITEPGAIPATFPETSIVATVVSTLLQVPPAVVLVRKIELPEQTVFAPDIEAGSGFIVSTKYSWQPPGIV